MDDRYRTMKTDEPKRTSLFTDLKEAISIVLTGAWLLSELTIKWFFIITCFTIWFPLNQFYKFGKEQRKNGKIKWDWGDGPHDSTIFQAFAAIVFVAVDIWLVGLGLYYIF